MSSPKKRKAIDPDLKRPSELTEEEWVKVGKFIEQGLSFPTIGKELGVSTANGALNNAWERYQRKNYRWTPENDHAFRDWLGKALREGSTKLGIPKSAMEARLKVEDM